MLIVGGIQMMLSKVCWL